jgi:hypothetical protein
MVMVLVTRICLREHIEQSLGLATPLILLCVAKFHFLARVVFCTVKWLFSRQYHCIFTELAFRISWPWKNASAAREKIACIRYQAGELKQCFGCELA